MSKQHTFQIQLEGLITLLAQNLYADPDVFLREMLQNAHDSIQKRKAIKDKRKEHDLPEGRIHVRTNREASTIEIDDNGAGLLEQELHEYLATIGRSGTRELRDELARGDRTQAVSLIGQFGIGLLSAFIVAARVDIDTLAAGGAPLRWSSTGDRHYQVEAGARATVGTTVTLTLREDHLRYLDLDRLRGIVRRYADFLGVPVHLGDDPEPANAVNAPWHRRLREDDEQRAEYRQFWESRFKDECSLDVFAVNEKFTYSVGEQTETGLVQGILGITDRHVPDVNTRGTTDLYIARMFICSGSREVLPPWARFIQGIVECNVLTPNAARDDVIRNATLRAAQEALGRRIVKRFTELPPERLQEILRWHSYHVLAMCVQDEHAEFFRAMADMVPLDSDLGPITLPAYLHKAPRRTDGVPQAFYIEERGTATQFYMLSAAKGLHVLNCSEPFAERFLRRYAETWPKKLHLTRLDLAGSEMIFEPLRDEAERALFEPLSVAYLQIFPDLRCIAQVERFKPTEVPALLTESRGTEARSEMEGVVNNMALPGALRGVVGRYLNQQRDPLVLHLNADNPTIQSLAERGTCNDEVSRNALVALYNNALMFRARTLRLDDIRLMFQQYNRVIDLMLGLHRQTAELQSTVVARETEVAELRGDKKADERARTPHVSCFVALDYKDPRAATVYTALKAVLEASPYNWQLVRADDNVEDANLWTNVKMKMQRAHCFIAEVSQHNPNVMIEIGRMEPLGRPLLLLKASGAPELPADLKGHLYGEYVGSESALVGEIREMLKKQKKFIDQNGERFLSPGSLVQAGLREDDAKHVAEKFESWSGFLTADPTVVGRLTGVRRPLIQAAQEILRADEGGDG